MKSAVAVLCILLEFPFAALAETKPECSEEWPTRCAVPIKANEKAPFTGQLLTDDLAIYLGQTTDSWEKRMQLEVTKTASIAKENLKKEKKLAAADLRVVERERDLYKQAADRSFLEQPAVVAIITTVAVTAIFLVANAVVRLGREIQQ